MSLDFILGGVRSGKSAYAEKLAISYGDNLHYIATAEIIDEALQARINLHKQRRENHAWQVHEESLQVPDRINALSDSGNVVLLDSFDMWVNNLIYHKVDIVEMSKAFLSSLQNFKGHLVVVSAEVGLSALPMDSESRLYFDLVGEWNQELAELSHRAVFVIAGLPLALKGILPDF